jgi:ribosomal protein S18 acetylase RimI-like enzyme
MASVESATLRAVSLDVQRTDWQACPMATIEPPRQGDLDSIRLISESAFAEYGTYGEVIQKFFSVQGVTTYVARIQSRVVGFVMLGFLPWGGADASSDPWIADLLAIAVEPDHQAQGIGTQLMQQAFELTRDMSDWREVREIQLTCASSNQAGLRFFIRHGFKVINPNHGSYSGGQPAMRLARKFR